ncbi:MAG TPA: nuclear transport factor 2 family protein [Gemmatimonadales bacterium]
MKRIIVTLFALVLVYSAPATAQANAEQVVLNLSKTKWRWMSERNVDSLATLFDKQAVFVHMGGTWGTDRELDVIKSGGIWYKHAEIFETSVRFIGSTAIVLNRIQLDAVVGGNAVTNPFMVTEVYVQQNDTWKLGSLSFTRLLTQ